MRECAAQLCITAGADMNLIERWRRKSRSSRSRDVTGHMSEPHQ